MDATQAYCMALLNQEKSLEELQKHLHKTEELFRESVKRKNQQLDLLQTEVRRLKTNVAGRENEASAQADEMLLEKNNEIERLRNQLATRELEVDALAAQVSQLKAELVEERAWRQAETRRAEEAIASAGKVSERDSEIKGLHEQLQAAQAAAARLGSASSDAEQALKQRDVELERLRAHAKAGEDARAASELTERELQLLRERLERRDEELAAARSQNEELQVGAASAQELLNAAQEGRGERDELEAALYESRDKESAMAARAEAAEAELTAQQQRYEQQQQELQQAEGLLREARAAAVVEQAEQRAETSSAPMRGVEASTPGRVDAEAEGDASGADDAEQEAAVLDLQIGGEATMGGTLSAQVRKSSSAASLSFAWFRSKTQQPGTGATYLLTALDIGHEITVRVTPIASDGSIGPAVKANTSIVAVAPEVGHKLKEWLSNGRQFDNCFEGEKERILLFTHAAAGKPGKLKVKEATAGKPGKTIHKEGYSMVRVDFAAEGNFNFTLTLSGKKGATLQLRAPNEQRRNLIYLTLMAFRDGLKAVEELPKATTTLNPSSALELADSAEPQGMQSPASSVASEQPRDQELAEAVASKFAGGRSLGGALSGVPLGRRTLSFGRKKGKG